MRLQYLLFCPSFRCSPPPVAAQPDCHTAIRGSSWKRKGGRHECGIRRADRRPNPPDPHPRPRLLRGAGAQTDAPVRYRDRLARARRLSAGWNGAWGGLSRAVRGRFPSRPHCAGGLLCDRGFQSTFHGRRRRRRSGESAGASRVSLNRRERMLTW